MSGLREDRYYLSQTKSRMSRSPPGGESQNNGVFQTGQGGRTVLPPISSAFPSSHFPVPPPYPSQYPQQYSQQRSSPGRIDHSTALYNGQWTGNNPAARQASSSLPYYEQPDPRYFSQAPIPSYPSRSSPLPQGDPYSSRRHITPLSVSPPIPRDDRWQPNAAYPSTGHVQASGNVVSPTAAYPMTYDLYTSHQSASYSFPPVGDPRSMSHQMPPLNPMHMVPSSNLDRNMHHRLDTRGDSPYTRNSSNVSPSNYSQQSVSATVAEEPAVKKKRKRADAAQLEVLNETYNRTAFPSTEERAELARKLDMTPRSVQIWFQNKRQSMRQTGRPSSSAVSPTSHHGFSMPSSSHHAAHASVGGYGGSTGMGHSDISVEVVELPPDVSHHTSSRRRGRSHEDSVESRKWSSRGY